MLDILKASLDIIIPPACLNCGRKTRQGEIICELCQDFAPLPQPACPACGEILKTYSAGGVCPACQKSKRYFFDRVFAPFVYKKPLAQVLKLFKYRQNQYLGGLLAGKFTDFIDKNHVAYKDYDLITFVPLHRAKLREREYNQSRILAEKIAASLKLPLQECLEAKQYLPSQTTKSKEERRLSIKGNFTAKGNLKGKNVILVDDVITSGATASECARALKEKGARAVMVWAIAKSINENTA